MSSLKPVIYEYEIEQIMEMFGFDRLVAIRHLEQRNALREQYFNRRRSSEFLQSEKQDDN